MKSGQFDEVFFFIYDPQLVLNKPELFKELEERTDMCNVKVVITPTA